MFYPRSTLVEIKYKNKTLKIITQFYLNNVVSQANC